MGTEKKKAFLIYCDYKQHLELLSQEDCGKLFISLIEYADTGIPPKLTGAAAMAFSFIKAQMDRDEEKYEERCKINRQNGSKGGRPKKTSDDQPEDATEENQNKTEKTERFSPKPEKPDTDTGTDTETDTESDIPSIAGEKNPPKKTSAQEARFFEFWKAYPKKVGKASCLKAWQKIKPDQALFTTIMQAVEQQKHSEQWTKESGQFIPNPLTWLSQGRWDDELKEARSNEKNGQSASGNAGSHFERRNCGNGVPAGFKAE